MPERREQSEGAALKPLANGRAIAFSMSGANALSTMLAARCKVKRYDMKS